ncbi:MAG: hypothetical protein QN193_10135 [Armatimonadota bacterium]|nr:hypothetical protein [Armatimonadota bacterium]MDR7443550.1 hypothetical protein [Armatimonadota bacterium]MDR7570954.1 hypothetical protein [Armatimonadota bacterium]MDR7615048.1 hypothetical protein [Armatimonadota bacterium]
MEASRALFFPDPEVLNRRCCPVGWRVLWQASLWTVQGIYLARTPAGRREAWLILAEEREPD